MGQFVISRAWQHSVSECFQTKTETASHRATANIIRRRCDESGMLASDKRNEDSLYSLTQLLTYLLTYLRDTLWTEVRRRRLLTREMSFLAAFVKNKQERSMANGLQWSRGTLSGINCHRRRQGLIWLCEKRYVKYSCILQRSLFSSQLSYFHISLVVVSSCSWLIEHENQFPFSILLPLA